MDSRKVLLFPEIIFHVRQWGERNNIPRPAESFPFPPIPDRGRPPLSVRKVRRLKITKTWGLGEQKGVGRRERPTPSRNPFSCFLLLRNCLSLSFSPFLFPLSVSGAVEPFTSGRKSPLLYSTPSPPSFAPRPSVLLLLLYYTTTPPPLSHRRLGGGLDIA